MNNFLFFKNKNGTNGKSGNVRKFYKAMQKYFYSEFLTLFFFSEIL